MFFLEGVLSMARVIEGITLNPAMSPDRRRGCLIAIDNCVRSVELALQTCRAAALSSEYLEEQLSIARELNIEANELGDPTEWTREKDLEALRLMGRASTILSRAVGHVWIGCRAGEAAAVEANDPSVACAAAERGTQLAGMVESENNVMEHFLEAILAATLREHGRKRKTRKTSSTSRKRSCSSAGRQNARNSHSHM